jgi:hypothetical protein
MTEIRGKIERHISILQSHEAAEVQSLNLHKARLGDIKNPFEPAHLKMILHC